jgi:hypothetical protein
MSWAEFLDWLAFYRWRQEQENPEKHRVLRPKNGHDVFAALMTGFRITPKNKDS